VHHAESVERDIWAFDHANVSSVESYTSATELARFY
jgi:hypothetical protein